MLQALLDGFIEGIRIAAFGAAFMCAYLPGRVFHVALAAVFAGVPFIQMELQGLGFSSSQSVVLAVAAGVWYSVACEALNHARLRTRVRGSGAHLVSSLGVYTATIALVAFVWGSGSQFLRPGLDRLYRLGSVALSSGDLRGSLVLAVAMLSYVLWLERTRFGTALRALASNPEQFALEGFDVRRVLWLAFGVSGLLAGVTGLVTAFDRGFSPHVGFHALLLALTGVIVGGLDSFRGAIWGGLAIGLLRAAIGWSLGAQWADAVTFATMGLVLLFRPLGLFAGARRVEAAS